jgi:hypothetical protein
LNKSYCDEIAEGEKEPCSRIGPKRIYDKGKQGDEFAAEYDKAYKRYYARFSKGTMTWDVFDSWRIEATEKLKTAREKQEPLERFVQWLKETP